MTDYPDYAIAKTTKFQPTLLRPGDTLTLTLTLDMVGRGTLSAPVRFDHIDYVLHGVYVEPAERELLGPVSDYVDQFGGFMDVPGVDRMVPLAEVVEVLRKQHRDTRPYQCAEMLEQRFGGGER